MKEIIYIGSDHAGFKLKEEIKKFLSKSNYFFEDVGPFKYKANDDFPDYAVAVCDKVLRKKGSKGILFCGTGQGMSIVANKKKGIVSALCWDESSAKHAKEHLNANVISVPSTLKSKTVRKIIKLWMESKFINKQKYTRRLDKIRKIERGKK